jgi:hypothetical protein
VKAYSPGRKRKKKPRVIMSAINCEAGWSDRRAVAQVAGRNGIAHRSAADRSFAGRNDAQSVAMSEQLEDGYGVV